MNEIKSREKIKDDTKLVTTDKAVSPQQENTEKKDTITTPEIITEISIKTSRVEKIVMEISRVGGVTFDKNKNEKLYASKPVKIGTEKKGSRKEINALVALNFDEQKMSEDGITVRIGAQLTRFDKIIQDIITTLYVEGRNEYITPAMIFNVLTGNANRTMPPNFAKFIDESITRLMYTRISIEAPEEAIMYKKLTNFKYVGYLIPAEKVSAKLNGTVVSCIHLFRTPPLYDYADQKNQIGRLDINVLSKPFQNGKREEIIDATIVFYLIRRIIAMNSISNRTLYETIYEEIGYENASKQLKLKLRKKIKEILSSWENTEFGNIRITGYTEVKKRGVPYGIDILYQKIKIKKNEN